MKLWGTGLRYEGGHTHFLDEEGCSGNGAGEVPQHRRLRTEIIHAVAFLHYFGETMEWYLQMPPDCHLLLLLSLGPSEAPTKQQQPFLPVPWVSMNPS